MKAIFKALLRLVLTVLSVAIGFCIGFLAAAKLSDWWIVPFWMRHTAHMPQIEQGVFALSLAGGILGIFVALAIRFYFLFRATGRKNPQPDSVS